MNNYPVSIIVPVYNVEDYIDDCIESIVNQTFSNIEILLIVGQSSDCSTDKCQKWCLKDKRIRMVQEKQRGLGSARNQGIQEARGEYIVFVDSDDVIKATYVEKMYTEIVKYNADLAECDFSRIRLYSEKNEYVPCTKILRNELDVFNKFLLGNISMWKIMSKKTFWLENDILQPAGIAEDFTVYPILLFSAKKIVNISEDLYLYRKDRPGNLCGDSSDIVEKSAQIANQIEVLLKECIKRNYFYEHQKELSIYIRRWISRYISPYLGDISEIQYMKIKQKYFEIYTKYFFDQSFISEMILGGFNLSRIVNKLSLFEDPYCRINFTSLISIMSKKTKKHKIVHKNKYRKFMLEREYHKDFFELVEKQKPTYFFFDLLEERHDILEVDGIFFTKSDAFDEAEIDLKGIARVIKRESNECRNLWKKSCILFFEKLCTYVVPSNIIMIKTYLLEQYGDGKNKYYFNNLNKIRRINNLLLEYYQFIEDNFPKIQIVEVDPKDEYYYTDINFEFGCYPWHMNEWENIEIAKKIPWQYNNQIHKM